MPESQVSRHPLLRYGLLVIGWLSLVLGVIGIFLPLLPTTPFILLAAACFLRSSDRLYRWLVSHPRLGPYIEGYLQGKGVPRRAKISALLLMWPSLLITAFVLLDNQMVRVILPLVGVATSLYILRQPTLELAQKRD
jgi:uncharacterized membrane protein YbaN (DUF454 family)